MRQAFLLILLAAGLGFPAAAAPAPESASAILLELRSFREMGSVLYIAAHPDDENSRLIAYLARGRGYRTAYLSLTRGDGGQNLIGPELGEELGAIRTQELLGARAIDGGRQFFSRARDFGFSKDYRDTLVRWDRRQVLSDVVRTIRFFRPDVLITRFSTVPGGTHGHHTASAVLALEAFKLAGDPQAFPEQLDRLAPWQPKRIFWNNGGFGRGGAASGDTSAGAVHVDDGGYQPLLGESYGEIAAQSRSMQKTQGMGAAGNRGAADDSFRLLAGEPATKDIMDGIDPTWNRVAGGGAEIARLTDEAILHFNPEDPAASVPALLALRSRVAALAADPVVEEKSRQLDRILQACLGLHVETVIARAEVVPGEALSLRHVAIARAGYPVRWLGVRYPGSAAEIGKPMDLPPDRPATREVTRTLPADTPLSQPYWLREEGTAGMFRVDDPNLITQPENPPAYPIEQVFAVGGQTLVVEDQPMQVGADPAKGEFRRKMEVIPPVSLDFARDPVLFAPGSGRSVVVTVTAARAGAAGTLRLEAPAGWQAAPDAQPFRLAAAGEAARFTFTLTAPARSVSAAIVASAEIGGVRYRNRRVEIHYEHVRPILLQPVAQFKAVSLELAIRGQAVGYLPGAGDLVPECLEQMGYTVTVLDAADCTRERLRHFDAVVVGVRAFNTRTDLAALLPALFRYVDEGGTLIEQYNTNNGLKTSRLAPYDLELSSDRVVDEKAAVTLLAPENPVFTTPNRIGPADFDGWVQERARYLPEEWDPRFTALLSWHDAGEPPNNASLLVARSGRGYFVYTGISWFRELPAGVPGAFRLFANLVSLGK